MPKKKKENKPWENGGKTKTKRKTISIPKRRLSIINDHGESQFDKGRLQLMLKSTPTKFSKLIVFS